MNSYIRLFNIRMRLQPSVSGISLALCIVFAAATAALSAAPLQNSGRKAKKSREATEKVSVAQVETPEQAAVQWASRVVKVSSQLKSHGQYSSFQLLGKPNILSRSGDSNPCSWAATIDGQQPSITPGLKEIIRVGFTTPVQARQVAVAENLNPGAIGEIIVYGAKGEKDTVYRATPGPTGERWRMLNVFFNPPPFPVSEVELVVYTGMVLGWNEIDAIALGSTTDTIRPEINLVPGAPAYIAPENIGSRINSEYDEFFPIISPDGKTLYVSRNDHPGNVSRKTDIWYSELQPDGYWGVLENIGAPLNNSNTNFVCSIMPDGNTMLVGNLYYGNGGTGPGISITNSTKEGWSFPQALTINNFHNRGQFVNYFLASDSRTMLMALERDETYGGTDIYVCFLLDNGNWSTPLNLGHTVNTAGDESTVFLAPDNRTLYFSSEGHNGYGSHDIFMSRRLDNSWVKWSEPQNLGAGINTPDWDGYFSIPASGEYAYFVSNSNSFGGSDIFRTPLPQVLRPRPVVLMSGIVVDAKTREPIEADIVVQRLIEGTPVAFAHSNPTTGRYALSLPSGDVYSFYAQAKGYFAVNENIDLLHQNEYDEQSRNLQLVPIEAGQSVDLNNIFFETGKWEILPESASELERIVELLGSNPRMSITVIGHTDDVGSEPDPDWLSHFLALAENIRHPAMQQFWAGILTQEIARPGHCSIPALNCLRQMTQKDALLLQRASALSCHFGDDQLRLLFGYQHRTMLQGLRQHKLSLGHHRLSYAGLLQLFELGLLHQSELESGELPAGAPLRLALHSRQLVLTPARKGVRLLYYRFTSIGNELAALMSDNPPGDYLRELTELLAPLGLLEGA